MGMRVLYWATEYPPIRGYGLARYAWEHSQALARAGVQVEVVCDNFNDEWSRCDYPGLAINNVPYRVPFDCYGWVGGILHNAVGMFTRAAECVARRGPFDLLHAHDWRAASAARALHETSGLPLVLTMRGTQVGKCLGPGDAESTYLAEMEQWVCEWAAGVTVNSAFLREELARVYHLPPERVEVVGAGVNPRSLLPGGDPRLFRRLFGEAGDLLVACVGRLVPTKGPQVLLEALPRLLAVCPQARVIFVGEGSLREGLTRRAAELGIAERVTLPGHVYGRVLGTLYHAVDLVVVPSLYEPFGMVALEAMACGRPVVVSDTGGLGELVEEGVSGLKVPPNDPAALAEAVVRLSFAPELRDPRASRPRPGGAVHLGGGGGPHRGGLREGPGVRPGPTGRREPACTARW
jgi:glycogen(starch) synthase